MGQLANSVRADIEAALEQRKAALELPGRTGREAGAPRPSTSPCPARRSTAGPQAPDEQRPRRDQGHLHRHGLRDSTTAPRSSRPTTTSTELNIARRPPRPRMDRTPSISRRTSSILLRTQTSPMQIRAMETAQPAHPHRRPRPRLPQGRGRRHALPDVPPD